MVGTLRFAHPTCLPAGEDEPRFFLPLPPRGKRENRHMSILVFERDVELGAVGFDLALGIQLQVEFDDFGDTEVPEAFPGPVERRGSGLFPGLWTCTDQFDDLVDTLTHIVLPFGRRQARLLPVSLTSGHRR